MRGRCTSATLIPAWESLDDGFIQAPYRAGTAQRLRATSSRPKPARDRDVRGAVSRAFGTDVPHARRVASAHPGTGRACGRVSGADLHRFPRLRPRLHVPVQTREQLRRPLCRPAAPVAVSALAPRPRDPSCDLRRHRATRSRGCDHADGVRIPRSLVARSSRIPGNPQSAGDVRPWSDHRDDHRAAGADSSPAPTTSPQRGRHRRGARPDRGRHCAG